MSDPPPAADDHAQLEFLTRHWQVPIPPQGKPPVRFSSLEASLDPESCAVCHRAQYEDWSSSLHSKSTGPGVRGQTTELIHDDPKMALLCYSCHAPLTEQQEKIVNKGGPPSQFKRNLKRDRAFSASPPSASWNWASTVLKFKRNRAFSASLQLKGLSCVGCHVRGHQRFGPPKRDGSLVSALPASQLPHGGAIRTAAFERSEFCESCHQFEPNGYALNGTLLENTYNEWKAGPYAREGRACQSCHMPERRHLWRGIHDPEMVKQGVTVRLAIDKAQYEIGERLHAEITLANTGVGHNFPTYVTPKVVVRWEMVDAEGKRVEGSLQEERIGREVTLDLEQQLYDTRIPPGKSHTVRYERAIEKPGLKLQASVVVVPDDFYITFFEAILPRAKATEARTLLEQALREGRARSFLLFKEERVVS